MPKTSPKSLVAYDFADCLLALGLFHCKKISFALFDILDISFFGRLNVLYNLIWATIGTQRSAMRESREHEAHVVCLFMRLFSVYAQTLVSLAAKCFW
jgi:hypothetical protein